MFLSIITIICLYTVIKYCYLIQIIFKQLYGFKLLFLSNNNNNLFAHSNVAATIVSSIPI